MKTKLLISILILLVMQGCSSKPKDFRNVNWDMTEKEVRENDKANFDKEYLEEDDDEYDFKLKGKAITDYNLNADISYFFKDNKLKAAVYIIMQKDNPGKRIIEEFEKIKNDMELKYGKYDKSNGPLSKIFKWYDHNTRVGLSLFFVDTISITYWKAQ